MHDTREGGLVPLPHRVGGQWEFGSVVSRRRAQHSTHPVLLSEGPRVAFRGLHSAVSRVGRPGRAGVCSLPSAQPKPRRARRLTAVLRPPSPVDGRREVPVGPGQSSSPPTARAYPVAKNPPPPPESPSQPCVPALAAASHNFDAPVRSGPARGRWAGRQLPSSPLCHVSTSKFKVQVQVQTSTSNSNSNLSATLPFRPSMPCHAMPCRTAHGAPM